jgi:ribosomal protein S12 methylthiotransferase
MISLGCAKNLVDAEIMLGSLMKAGLDVTNDTAKADVVIVNTCSFIDSAQEESVDAILESAEVREAARPDQGLIVSGCMPQRYRDQMPNLFPEVDGFMGIDQVTKVGEIVKEAYQRRRTKVLAGQASRDRKRRKTQAKAQIAVLDAKLGTEKPEQHSPQPGASSAPVFEVTNRPKFIPDFSVPRYRLTPRHFAYVKIAEGCNHPCSFCTIPRMRGSHRSRLQEDVVSEARVLIADEVRELNLISQDSTYYGMDLRASGSRALASPTRFRAAAQALPKNATTLSTLLRALNRLEGDFWIRLLYTHPAHWTDELIDTIGECSKVVKYVDMPLQHIHENMLSRMRRETTRQHIEDLIAKLRSRLPQIALRTTFIVGFPGETKEYFTSLLDFLREARFERAGVFTYSQEQGTVAARMGGQVSEEERQERRHMAMAVQQEVSRSWGARQVGKTLRVLLEHPLSAQEAKAASLSNSEHGLVREEEAHRKKLRGAWTVSRSESDAPDIDGRVYVKGAHPAGNFARVKVVAHTDYDLIAEPL